MENKDKTQGQLIRELIQMRQRIAELEAEGRKRNQFEEALRTERDKAQQCLDIAEVMLVVLDKNGIITLLNRKGHQILEYKEGELLGKNWFATCLPVHLRKNVKGVFQKLMAGEGKQTEFYENPVLTKSGTERIITWHNTVLKDAQGTIIGTLSSGEDITERKQIEEEKRSSENRYKTLFDSASDAVFIIDMAGQFIDVNQVACKRLGYRKEELLQMTPMDIDAPEYASLVQKRIKTLRKQGYLLFETVQVRRDGTAIPTELSSRVIEYNGKPAVLSIARDITERKQAEEALRESETRFRTLFEGISDTVLVHDDEGNILHINEIGAERLEESAKNLVGRNLREIVTPENAASIADHVRETHKVGWCRFETTYVSRSGWQIIAEVIERPIKFGKVKAILSVAHDITERKRAEESLREKEETIRALVETSQDWIWSIDLNGIHTYSNPAIEKILGYTPADLIGKSSLKLMHDEDRQAVRVKLPQWINEKCGWRNLILRWRHKDGSWRWLESNSVPMFGRTGKVIGFRGVDRDITERKRAEALFQVRMRLMEFAATHSLKELLQRTLDEVCEFTNSSVGFYHFVEADQKKVSLQAWSTRTVEEFCTATAEGMHYSIGEAGVWVDCIRERRPVIHNDYASLPHRKGMPEGHAAIVRELVVPIMRNDRFVAILGVGNKSQDYIDQDVQVVSYLADVAWEIAERQKAEEALRESAEKYRIITHTAMDGFSEIDQEGRFLDVNEESCRMSGYSRDEHLTMTITDIEAVETTDKIAQHIKNIIETGSDRFESRLRRKDGRIIDIEASSTYSPQTGHLLIFHRDISDRKRAEQERHHSYQQMQEMLVTTVNALASTVEMKDQYTAGHQPRVTQLACAIAEEMGLSEEQIDGIRMAGLIHDIGKIMVPAEILNKPGPLTEIQYEMVKMHSRAGYDILKGIKFPWPVAQTVLQHHELMDGSGYPEGLSGEEILLEARILTVANVFEAMISHRPYRAAYDIKEALAEILKNKGILFDPVVVDTCRKLFVEKRFAFT